MNKEYLKNVYYTNDIIDKAKDKTRQFYQGTFKPVLFKRGNKKYII